VDVVVISTHGIMEGNTRTVTKKVYEHYVGNDHLLKYLGIHHVSGVYSAPIFKWFIVPISTNILLFSGNFV
jgi:hypothetical protein